MTGLLYSFKTKKGIALFPLMSNKAPNQENPPKITINNLDD